MFSCDLCNFSSVEFITKLMFSIEADLYREGAGLFEVDGERPFPSIEERSGEPLRFTTDLEAKLRCSSPNVVYAWVLFRWGPLRVTMVEA